ncbi:hypothetical protein CUMW_115770 [Citrus unshiu]|uniref:Uncharacterized protein n=1 Tax=Citrus unshiu TaxID=55188 RepID=A0A2H5P9E5_CITUN|nr:hypothetical protein CUMW_115770 [Citrus unshiu]
MADIEEQNETKFSDLDGRPKRRKQTKKKHLLKRLADDKVILQHNQYGAPIGDGANDLRSYIGVLVRDNISILFDDWRHVPLEIKDKLWDHLQTKLELDIKSKKHVVQSMGIALRNFICALNTEFIQPNKDNHSQLKLPPRKYPRIRKLEWKQFVDKVLDLEFEDEILSAALGKQPNGSRVQGLGKSITPTMYFHIPNTTDLLEQRMTIESKAADIIEEDSPKNGQSTAKTKVAHMMEADSHNERKLAETPSVKTKKKTPGNTPKRTQKVIIDFAALRNEVIDLWARYLHESIENDEGMFSVGFGQVMLGRAKPQEEYITQKSRHMSELFRVALLGQITLIIYNLGGVRMYHSIKFKTKLNLKWVIVQFKGITEYSDEDLMKVQNE